jgi:hypothetical protein
MLAQARCNSCSCHKSRARSKTHDETPCEHPGQIGEKREQNAAGDHQYGGTDEYRALAEAVCQHASWDIHDGQA